MRTASEKLRSRTSISACPVQPAPGSRVNRFIGRLIEARQTDSDTLELRYLTLEYRNPDRERRVRRTLALTHTTQDTTKDHLINCKPTCLVTDYGVVNANEK